MQSEQARNTFLDFYARNGHTVVPSASLIPRDATVMFSVAGMVQFAPYFLGTEPAPFPRATSVQKVMRAGGKQNDLEEVGTSLRHQTFFEMLGNFSFGDYFKSDACRFAWELCTSDFGLDPDRVWASVFDDDDEAAEIWEKEVGLPASRIVRFGRKDNFWTMGGAGPCGPCSELFYDFGDEFGPDHPTGPKGGDENRYREFYNLVFMQYVQDDDEQIVGELERKGIDTGMGLERMLTILQGVGSNYETDAFLPIMDAAEGATGLDRSGDANQLRVLRILADHARAMTFLIADGVMPSNEGRGYVLRRIIRRSITKARQLGVMKPILTDICASVIDKFGSVYPEVERGRSAILEIVGREEIRFSQTLEAGLGILTDELAKSKGQLSGEVAFTLYDTFGFPLEITNEVAADAGVEVDEAGFAEAMKIQKDRSRARQKDKAAKVALPVDVPDTEFLGYSDLSADSRVAALLVDDKPVQTLTAGQDGQLILTRTPFYPEGGGQIGDTGEISGPSGRLRVTSTVRRGGAIVHAVSCETGSVSNDEPVTAVVDAGMRRAAERAHTATHVLHFQLRDALGDHVRQMGSLVEPGRLRFDFAHFASVNPDTLAELEAEVNTHVRDDDDVNWFETDFIHATQDLGATAFFEDKYGDVVRVVEIGDGWSRELCGGTHVGSTGRIGFVKLVSESSIGANIRRVEALVGEEGLKWVNRRLTEAQRAAELMRTSPDDLTEGIERLMATQKDLQRQLDDIKKEQASSAATDLGSQAEEINGAKLIVSKVDLDVGAARELAIRLRDQMQRGIVILGLADGGKANLICGVAGGDRIRASDVIADAAAAIGGRAGGKPNLAMGGGSKPDALDEALKIARKAAELSL